MASLRSGLVSTIVRGLRLRHCILCVGAMSVNLQKELLWGYSKCALPELEALSAASGFGFEYMGDQVFQQTRPINRYPFVFCFFGLETVSRIALLHIVRNGPAID